MAASCVRLCQTAKATGFMKVTRKVPTSSNVWTAAAQAIETQLGVIKEEGTWKCERVIQSKQEALIKVENKTEKVLNFCANNYLGLSGHPVVIKSAREALEKYGAGLSSVRFICGTQSIHKQLEKQIAQFHEREDSILYASCFDANAGIFEVLLSDKDAVISDELNHASIIDGIRLCKAQRHRYKHRDMEDLEAKLAESKNCRLRMIVTDGVFSMDGNFAPLEQICALAKKYDAIVFVDECHATGFVGTNGQGTEEYFKMKGQVDIINSTLGKALGGAAGGYTTGKKELIDLLRQKSRPYLFSNSLPPAVVASAAAALRIIKESSDLREKVMHNTRMFRSSMKSLGFKVLGDDHPICPVLLGDAKLTAKFADAMLDKGIYVIGFSYPVVPKGKARIRVQLSAAHSKDDIKRTVDAFAAIGKQLNVI